MVVNHLILKSNHHTLVSSAKENLTIKGRRLNVIETAMVISIDFDADFDFGLHASTK